MRHKYLIVLGATALAACASDMGETPPVNVSPSLRVVNAFTTPVDVLVDGNVAISGLAAGTVGTAAAASGSHTVQFKSSTAGSFSQSVTTATGAVNTFAVVRASTGSVSAVALDDTNSVVPANATKVRVLHMAANGGVLQVFRTQPDFQKPVYWQFPFTYQSAPTSLSAPFYQSTVGTWEIHVWQTPADSSGWSSAPIKLLIPLASGEKKTVVILDNPAGGLQTQVF